MSSVTLESPPILPGLPTGFVSEKEFKEVMQVLEEQSLTILEERSNEDITDVGKTTSISQKFFSAHNEEELLPIQPMHQRLLLPPKHFLGARKKSDPPLLIKTLHKMMDAKEKLAVEESLKSIENK